MKLLSRSVLGIYLLTLTWLVLFKFSFDIPGVFLYHHRSLNLIPFAGLTPSSWHDLLGNIIVFIPFGLLLSTNFKQLSFNRKLATIFAFSLAVEILQFIFAIGASDITDVISNTEGGLLGLLVYEWSSRHSDHKVLDWCIHVVIAVLLVWLILFRVLVLRVRY